MVEHIVNEGVFGEQEFTPPASVDPLKAYRFIREAIMDAMLPVSKVIGFSLTDTRSYYRVTAEERNGFVLESFVKIATNFMDKIVIDDTTEILACNIPQGRLTADKEFQTLNKETFRMLYVEPEILSASENLTLSLCIHNNTGYRTTLENSKQIHQSSYFPIPSYHSLADFIRIMPYDGHIRYRFYHGANLSLLKNSFMKLKDLHTSGALNEEVEEWLSSYVV